MAVQASQLVNITWQPPATDWWDFTPTYDRCDAATSWGSDLFVAVKRNPELIVDHVPHSDPITAQHIISYIRALMREDDPRHLNETSDQVLIAWYYQMWYYDLPHKDNTTLDFRHHMLDFSIEGCSQYDLMCHKIQWDGDPDVSGQGMIVSYYFVGVVTTLYLIALLAYKLNVFRHPRTKVVRALAWVFKGCEATVSSFVDADLLFTIGMLGASIVRFDLIKSHPKESFTAYGLVASVTMSTFSILSTIVLQMVSKSKSNYWLRIALWVVVAGLAVAVEVLYRRELVVWNIKYETPDLVKFYEDEHPEQITDLYWLGYCDAPNIRHGIEVLLTARIVLLVLNALWMACMLWGRVVSLLRGPRWLRRVHPESTIGRLLGTVRPSLKIINALVCCLFMWTFLVLFSIYRNRVADATTNWHTFDSTTDSSWTFGQVLALATWAPSVLEMANVYIYGVEEGLGARLVEGYHVVSDEPDEVTEKRSKIHDHSEEDLEADGGGEETPAVERDEETEADSRDGEEHPAS